MARIAPSHTAAASSNEIAARLGAIGARSPDAHILGVRAEPVGC